MKPRQTRKPFAVEIKRLIEERGISRRALAREAGVDPGFFTRVLQGKKPLNDNVIKKVSRALDLPSDYFIEARRAKLLRFSSKEVDDVLANRQKRGSRQPRRVSPDSDDDPATFEDRVSLEPRRASPGGSRGPNVETIVQRLLDSSLTEGSLARLGAAVLLRYEEDPQFQRDVANERRDIEQLAQEKMRPWHRVTLR